MSENKEKNLEEKDIDEVTNTKIEDGNDSDGIEPEDREEAAPIGLLEELQKKLEEKEKEIEELRNYGLRMQADFENFRRRTRQEKEEISERITADLLLALLPVYDNLERALKNSEKGGEENIRAGVEMIHRQFTSVLEALGVQGMAVENTSFDPSLHEAVMVEENPDLEDNTILEAYQKGYMLNGRVLRPAMVKVVKNS